MFHSPSLCFVFAKGDAGQKKKGLNTYVHREYVVAVA